VIVTPFGPFACCHTGTTFCGEYEYVGVVPLGVKGDVALAGRPRRSYVIFSM
jgi:hypothetical protein